MLVKISGKAGCGKTTLAHEIKKIMAEKGKSTLIIEDGDTASKEATESNDVVVLVSINEK